MVEFDFHGSMFLFAKKIRGWTPSRFRFAEVEGAILIENIIDAQPVFFQYPVVGGGARAFDQAAAAPAAVAAVDTDGPATGPGHRAETDLAVIETAGVFGQLALDADGEIGQSGLAFQQQGLQDRQKFRPVDRAAGNR
jgi:hypothetical protein